MEPTTPRNNPSNPCPFLFVASKHALLSIPSHPPKRRALILRFLTLGERSPYFTQVYPDPADVEAVSTVRLYRVDCPDVVASRSEYSATDFPTTEFRDAWMFDLPAAP